MKLIAIMLSCISVLSIVQQHMTKLKDQQPLIIDTKCTKVHLNSTYNYDGVVRSGYLRVGAGNSVLGLLLYGKLGEKESALKQFPTIMVLGGGPGSSSQLINFHQIGPLTFRTSSPSLNNLTWANNYNLLFVDQPIGTGLSYAEKDAEHTTLEEITDQLYFALDQLYNNQSGCFNKVGISGSQPFFVLGEGFGAKFAAAIGEKIVQQNKNKPMITGFKGVILSSPFMQPYSALSQLGMMSYHLGLIDYQQRAKLEKILVKATRHYLSEKWDKLHEDFDSAMDWLQKVVPYLNLYDLQADQQYQQMAEPYFNDPDILALYGLEDSIQYVSHSSSVFDSLSQEFMKVEVKRVENLLKSNVPVLILAGQDDVILPVAGTLKWVDQISYQNSKQFQQQVLSAEIIDGKVVAGSKTAGLLSLSVIKQAGHKVSMKSPSVTLKVVDSFIERSM